MRNVGQGIESEIKYLCAFSVFECLWRMGESGLSALIHPN